MVDLSSKLEFELWSSGRANPGMQGRAAAGGYGRLAVALIVAFPERAGPQGIGMTEGRA